MASQVEIQAMRHAIALSAHGLGTTSPNPPVGCVVVDGQGRILGEGYHHRKGEAHAEGNALCAAGGAAIGATAIVTLEPCNHVGRAPACRQLLIDAGIVRVVVALVDPTSRGEGGVAALRNAGVEVEVGVLADEAELVLGPWLSALRTGRPTITWSYIADVSGPASALDRMPGVMELRKGVDAVLHADGRLEEGVLGGHGAGMINIPSRIHGDGDTALRSLYAGGVRSLLIDGGAGLTEPLLSEGLIDYVVAYLPHMSPSSSTGLGHEIVLAGFRITQISRAADHVCVHARREAAAPVIHRGSFAGE
ncbi:bifunctional diaminohydroxyphosphoribosylaminopyrimidine deaminase/5-amino-6-(5-phosphoribosylamino)uracil reductase RibD [Sphaerisporangium sp. NBC_01403]|uniref:bifunctional diaminohydroxyphosphoribosylaminopyrimidine deaminase/5-amino-6-(5-phosphoribosylamino)uracil reductase RibD n=1 Tax=Sphaerisporangium sp. NBC_01403 TaxID=2903599 RepID=UPI00324C459A